MALAKSMPAAFVAFASVSMALGADVDLHGFGPRSLAFEVIRGSRHPSEGAADASDRGRRRDPRTRVRPQKATSNQARSRRLIAKPGERDPLSWPDTLIAFKIDRRTKTAKSGSRNNSYDLPEEICARSRPLRLPACSLRASKGGLELGMQSRDRTPKRPLKAEPREDRPPAVRPVNRRHELTPAHSIISMFYRADRR